MESTCWHHAEEPTQDGESKSAAHRVPESGWQHGLEGKLDIRLGVSAGQPARPALAIPEGLGDHNRDDR